MFEVVTNAIKNVLPLQIYLFNEVVFSGTLLYENNRKWMGYRMKSICSEFIKIDVLKSCDLWRCHNSKMGHHSFIRISVHEV